MSSNLTRAAGIALLLVGTLMIAAAAKAEPLKRAFSGWSVATEIDTNGDGSRAVSLTYQSSGTFGKTTSNAQAEVSPAPVGDCFGKWWILKYRFVAFSAVDRYQDGDLLISTLDPDPDNPSTQCLDLSNFTSSSTINVVVLGGTGRFEGSTGWATAIAEGQTLANDGDRPTHGAFSASLEGEIFLADN
jgi:hypothetical protein